MTWIVEGDRVNIPPQRMSSMKADPYPLENLMFNPRDHLEFFAGFSAILVPVLIILLPPINRRIALITASRKIRPVIELAMALGDGIQIDEAMRIAKRLEEHLKSELPDEAAKPPVR